MGVPSGVSVATCRFARRSGARERSGDFRDKRMVCGGVGGARAKRDLGGELTKEDKGMTTIPLYLGET